MPAIPTVYVQLGRLINWHPAPWTIERQVELESIISRMFPQDGDVVDYVRLMPELSRPVWISMTYKCSGNWRLHPVVITPTAGGFHVSLMDYLCDKHRSTVRSYFIERLSDRKLHLDM